MFIYIYMHVALDVSPEFEGGVVCGCGPSV